MSGFAQSSVSSQNSQGAKRKWVPEEDVALVACMVDLYNVRTYNAYTGFKVIVYDLLSGKDNSDFGWDEHRQMVVAEDVVWNSYINRATRKDAQTVAYIVEEIDAENVAIGNNLEERNIYRGCKYDVCLDEMDVSAFQQPKPNQDGSTSSKNKKKRKKKKRDG
ncbi:tRNA uridine 5-carboxymethylaminomethyl modification enzyme MnmG [Gossypium arboreum]|uniref:tRNA uridine 5-carboxymethylaminomethyl modification enzyme MnmG n=1 Tax=Gossypium arboreum TaxID=29729 RepID=A0A0B0N3R1_GOSAR|nr:tRNA uridine 5-carboxymethylaminomethyl modification enzyme MnmG [Gossypium arboreum]